MSSKAPTNTLASAIHFGTDGWRSIIGFDFTFDRVRQVAGAIAAYMKDHGTASRGLLIGYDPRFLSEKFADAVARVVQKEGIGCLITPSDVPTPVIAYAVKARQTGGAVMITASHNPAEYSGIKFIPEYAGPASPEITAHMEATLKKLGNDVPASSDDPVPTFDPYEEYQKQIRKLVDFDVIGKSHPRVAYDALHGAGRSYLPRLLKESGCEAEILHENRDVLFGGRMPNPVASNLAELADRVKATRASLGLATDGDADRFGVLDSQGRYYGANQLIPVLLDYLVTSRGLKGSVVRSLATTQMMDAVAKHHGLTVHETPVGFKYIADWMMKEDVLIGGEESGGLSILGHIPEKDGLLANLLTVEMVARTGRPLDKLYQELQSKVGPFAQYVEALHLTPGQQKLFVDRLKTQPPQHIGKSQVTKIFTLDGVKLCLGDSAWVLARPSGTEPLIRLYAEAPTADDAQALVTDLKHQILPGYGA